MQVEILVSRKTNKYGDEVGSWLDGLFTGGLCTAAAIGKLLWQLTLKVSEGESPTSVIFCNSFKSLAAGNWKERRPKQVLALGM